MPGWKNMLMGIGLELIGIAAAEIGFLFVSFFAVPLGVVYLFYGYFQND